MSSSLSGVDAHVWLQALLFFSEVSSPKTMFEAEIQSRLKEVLLLTFGFGFPVWVYSVASLHICIS